MSEPNPALGSLLLEQFGNLRSNIAAESRAKIVYERLINITDDPGIKEALGFLMTREIAHQKSFEKALCSIKDNFPPGRRPRIERFANVYVNTSQGDGDMDGPWNSGDQSDRAGPGAGLITGGDKGGAKDIKEGAAMADAL